MPAHRHAPGRNTASLVKHGNLRAARGRRRLAVAFVVIEARSPQPLMPLARPMPTSRHCPRQHPAGSRRLRPPREASQLQHENESDSTARSRASPDRMASYHANREGGAHDANADTSAALTALENALRPVPRALLAALGAVTGGAARAAGAAGGSRHRAVRRIWPTSRRGARMMPGSAGTAPSRAVRTARSRPRMLASRTAARGGALRRRSRPVRPRLRPGLPP